MTKCKGFSKMWFLVLLLVSFVAGCGDNESEIRSTENQSDAKAITAYSINGVTGTVNEAAKTIAVTMPSGTDKTSLVATFTTTGIVTVGTTVQTSGTMANNFTNPVTYTVTAANGTTATYTVTVTVALTSAKAITSYSINGVAGTINETAGTIAVTVPNGTDKTGLIAAFTTTGTVKVGTTVQTSGTTTNNFTSPVVYTVTAGDLTTKTYTVTVTTAAAASSDKAITAFGFTGSVGIINEAAKTITVNVPSGTNRNGLIATFTTTPLGAGVKVGTTVQTSGTTANNFTNQVTYTVTAANGTTATYTVTVTVAPVLAAGPAAVNLGTAANFAILAKTGVSTIPASVVTGDVGVSPYAAIALTGFGLAHTAGTAVATSTQVTGNVYAADYAVPTPDNLRVAVLDMQAAYTDAAGRIASSAATTNVGSGTLTGLTLTRGVYEWGSNVTIPTNLTLSGSPTDVWIFKVAGTLDMAAAKNVILSGGALPQNIFWQVAGAVSIGANTVFKGNILGQTSITFGDHARIDGRLLAQSAVNLAATTVTKP